LVKTHEKRVQRFPGKGEYLSELAAAHHGHAELLRERKELMPARRAQERAVQHQQLAVAALPRDRQAAQTLTRYTTVLVEALLQEKDHNAVLALLQTQTEVVSSDRAAVYLARCVVLAAKDVQRQKLYSDRALEALRRACRNGFKDHKALR